MNFTREKSEREEGKQKRMTRGNNTSPHFEWAMHDFSTSLDGCGRRLRSTWTDNNFGGC